MDFDCRVVNCNPIAAEQATYIALLLWRITQSIVNMITMKQERKAAND